MNRVYKKIRNLLRINNDIDEIKKELLDTKRLVKEVLYDAEEERNYLSRDYLRLEEKRNSDQERILLCGYYGARNGGDELMLRAILDNMPKNKDVTILLSQNYGLDSIEYFPYKTIHYPKKPNDCRYLAEHFDTIVWGGGAVLDDEAYYFGGADCSLTYAEMTITKMMQEMGKRVIVLGVSANREIKNKKMIDDLNLIIDRAEHFSVRDKNSLKTLSDAGVKTEKVELIDDLALANDYRESKSESGVVGIVCITDDIEKIKAIISSVQENLEGYYSKIKLISFFNLYGHDIRQYEAAIEQLGVKGEKIEIVDTDFDIPGISKALSECEMIVSMRYHATLIGGFVFGRKVLCINYGSHRHYYNKNKYIKDVYIPGLITVDYDDILNEEKMTLAIKKTFKAEAKNNEKQIEKIKNKLKSKIEKTLK